MPTLFTRRPLALAMACLASAPVLAQETDTTADATLEPVEVWATEVKASSVKLDGEAMAIKQADHISDLLRPVPGVDVGGAHSLNQRITIRSMDDKDIRVSIDGANQNTYMYHHMGNLQINADILKSVEIDVGNNSVVNGGLGGAVRFETKQAKELLRPGQDFGARVQASYGDNAYVGSAVTGYGQLTDSLDVLAYYNLMQRDNFEVGGGEIKDANGDVMEGTDGTVRGLEGDVDDALLKLGWDFAPGQRIALGYEAYRDEGDYAYRPDMGLATGSTIANALGVPLEYPTEFTRDTITLNYDGQFGASSTLKATLFENQSDFWRDESGLAESVNPGIRGTAGIKEGEATNTGLNVLANTEFEGVLAQSMTYGYEQIRYKTQYDALYLDDSRERAGEEATSNALFLQDRIGLGGGVAVIPGVRYDFYDIDSAVVKDTYNEVTGALALEYEPVSSVLLRASSTQLFKGPELAEVYIGAGLFDEANPDIEAETGYNHELAAAYEDAVLGADRFSLGATVFRTEIDNYIFDYAETDLFYGKDNVGDMTIDGYEAYTGYDFHALRMLLTYSVADSELAAFSEYASLDGARLDRVQGDTISLDLDYDLAALDTTLHWDVLAVDDVDADVDLDGATLDTAKDGYVVHNISARWMPRSVDGLELTLGVDNLFDEYYASQSSRTGVSLHPRFGELYLMDYEPGRNAKVTVAYQF
ncbi:MAG: TonB-dependent receptor domain-containing protein [Pseudomonadota bacterium]